MADKYIEITEEEFVEMAKALKEEYKSKYKKYWNFKDFIDASLEDELEEKEAIGFVVYANKGRNIYEIYDAVDFLRVAEYLL